MSFDRLASEASDRGTAKTSAAVTDTTTEFDVYTAPPRLGPDGKPEPKARGLRAGGPPTAPFPVEPLTKANLARQHLAPAMMPPPAPVPPAAPARPVTHKVGGNEMFEEYHREGYDPTLAPKGTKAAARNATEILGAWKEPEPEVVTPRRFALQPIPVPQTPAAPPPPAPEWTPTSGEPISEPHAPDGTEPAPPVGPSLNVAESEPLWQPPAAFASPGHSPSASSTFEPGPSPLETPTAQPENGGFPAELPVETEQAPHPIPDEPAALLAAPVALEASLPAADAPAPPAAPSAPPSWPTRTAPSAILSRLQGRPHTSGAASAPSGSGAGIRLAIVQARFNQDLTDLMAAAATARARELGCDLVAHDRVAGVFEAPLAAQLLAERDDVDAVVVVACVIQGETGHDEVITHAAARQVLEVSGRLRKPIGFGVTGPRMTRQQAVARIPSAAHAVEAVVALALRMRTT